MGGHLGGEIAAQIAVRLFIERFQQEAKPILRNPLKFMQETLLRAHAALASYASQFSMLETPRTTCVAAILQGNHAYWAHVGDSRLYLLRQGKLIGATKDHSKVQYLVDQGIIAPQDVPTHPDRNKIFSCLGGAAEPVIDLSKRTPLANGDILILCTDGLWSVYPMREMSTMLTSTPILTTAPQIMREAEAIVRLLEARLGAHAWITFSCRDDERISDGTPIVEAASMAASCTAVLGVGVNCTPPGLVDGLLRRVRRSLPETPLVAYPNLGSTWDPATRAWRAEGPRPDFGAYAKTWLDEGATTIGACCGTGPDDVAAIASVVDGA